ncbi:chromosome segregation protein [Allopseudospirillum japonicum]|uniref:Chromosome partition protein Smc n=1 Tax=Allopseudospirillum japonicum TaxID=64971 RepID=A0A1H6R518_9GAMM|nr:chromosome segregation protein [Allopseudospirillum japonicum]
MRLKSMRLVGFKSFVEPTLIHFPTNMTAIVGPNGCGKSNVIDAVRWVMGESSARFLRGESMTDVIFNGSESRPPAALAGIELHFDNQEGRLGGAYAAYAEISVKRQVTREGQSQYFLNGTRCRRRDITDLFLGTGLGPRSYAIIEQGMIARLIEARPEELRVYIEEAAGVSRYKERRKETATRMQRTQDNLSRLQDIDQELGKQLDKLAKQAQAARQYRELKLQEHQLNTQLSHLRWTLARQQMQTLQSKTQQTSEQFNQLTRQQHTQEGQIQEVLAKETQLKQVLEAQQVQVYQIKTELTRLQTAYGYQAQNVQETAELLAQYQQEIQTLTEEKVQAQALAEQLNDEQEALQEALLLVAEKLEIEQEQAQDLELAYQTQAQTARQIEQAYQAQGQTVIQAQHQIQLLETQGEYLQQSQQKLHTYLAKSAQLQQEAETLAKLQTQGATQAQTLQILAAQQEQAAGATQTAKQTYQASVQVLEKAQQAYQQVQAHLQALEAVQAQALSISQAPAGSQPWLTLVNIEKQGPLAHTLLQPWVKAHWLAQAPQNLQDLKSPATYIWPQQGEQNLPTGLRKIFALGAQNSWPQAWLAHLQEVVWVQDLQEAWTQRQAWLLQADSCASTPAKTWITADGIQLGLNWCRYPESAQDVEIQVLERQQTIRELKEQVNHLQQEVQAAQQMCTCKEAIWLECQQHQQQIQADIATKRAEYQTHQAQIQGLQARLVDWQQDQQGWQQEIEQVQAALTQQTQAYQVAQAAYEHSQMHLETLAKQQQKQQEATEQAQQIWQAYQRRLQESQHEYKNLQTQAQALHVKSQNLGHQQIRLDDRLQSCQLECERLQQKATQAQTQAQGLPELAQALAACEQALQDAQKTWQEEQEGLHHVQTQGQALHGELQRMQTEKESLRDQLQQEQLELQAARLACEHEAHKLAELNPELELETLPSVDLQQEPVLKQTWAQVQKQLASLGAVNLAAIEEYQAQAERKLYLEQQISELTEALQTLEAAIQRIDKETRQRFKITFDALNQGVAELFPQIFSGGRAYLELTSDNLLETGVLIKAQPPGKKNTSIQLLSGGEKALTAIALIFAIFQLNPAPFCMLDEVDAPLDDLNVARYAALVKQMSAEIQFIYITHNKQAMEAADQLLGVTMQEAGVSRPVAVDIDQALAIAQD